MKRYPIIFGLFLAIAPAFASPETTPLDRLRESLRRLNERADSGDSRALYELASLRENGFDTIPADPVEAVRLYRLAASKDFAPAQNYLGFMFYRGDIVPQNLDSAIFWIEKAAMQGDAKGANNLGWLLTEGRGIEHDYTQAAQWFAKAADAGLPAAMSQLGDLYRTGKGVPTDTLRAERLYRSAIEKGLGDAENKLLAMMHTKFSTLSADEAVKLGLDYYTHNATTTGVVLFEMAAEKEHPKALALLGDAYTHGRGVRYDHDKALEYFYKGAKLGDSSAQYIIGELLEIFPDALKGMRGHEPDDDIAAIWYEKASEGGVDNARKAQESLLRQQ